MPDDNTYKGQYPDVQPSVSEKRDMSLANKPRKYMTRSGTTVSFGVDLEPGTLIKHSRPRRDAVAIRAMKEARAALESRQDSCDTGDGDEWDDGDDDDDDLAAGLAPTRRRKRTTANDASAVPEYEFVDDFIAYKME